MMHGVTLSELDAHDSQNGVASRPVDAEPSYDTDAADAEDKREKDDESKEEREGEEEEINETEEKTKLDVETASPFTDYVNMDAYRRESTSSVESYDSFDDSEVQLETLFKAGHEKQLKKFLRVTTWPDDHLIRHSLWLSLCKHLHRADGNLYDEMEKELFSQCGS